MQFSFGHNRVIYKHSGSHGSHRIVTTVCKIVVNDLAVFDMVAEKHGIAPWLVNEPKKWLDDVIWNGARTDLIEAAPLYSDCFSPLMKIIPLSWQATERDSLGRTRSVDLLVSRSVGRQFSVRRSVSSLPPLCMAQSPLGGGS